MNPTEKHTTEQFHGKRFVYFPLSSLFKTKLRIRHRVVQFTVVNSVGSVGSILRNTLFPCLSILWYLTCQNSEIRPGYRCQLQRHSSRLNKTLFCQKIKSQMKTIVYNCLFPSNSRYLLAVFENFSTFVFYIDSPKCNSIKKQLPSMSNVFKTCQLDSRKEFLQ